MNDYIAKIMFFVFLLIIFGVPTFVVLYEVIMLKIKRKERKKRILEMMQEFLTNGEVIYEKDHMRQFLIKELENIIKDNKKC